MRGRCEGLLCFLLTILLPLQCEDLYAQTNNASLPTQGSTVELPVLSPDDFPEVENGWYSVPPWAEGLPFDLKSKFDIPQTDNREQLYMQVFAAWNPSFGRYTFPAYRAMDESALSIWNESASDQMQRTSDFVFDRCDEKGRFKILREAGDFEKTERLLAPYLAGLEKLKRTSQRPSCFFHSEWLPSSWSSVYDGKSVAYILALECNAGLEKPEALLCIELALQLKRDLVELGNQIEQLAGGRMERSVFDYMVAPVLQRPGLTLPEVDRLIEILRKHDNESSRADLYLEATKREILELRHVMHLLATGSFNTAERRKRFELDSDAHIITVLLREVADAGFYRLNSDQVREEVEVLAQANHVIRTAWEKAQANWSDEEDAEKGARILLGIFMSGNFESMNQTSIARDIAVLDRRYRDVEQACQLPYPESTQQLSLLQDDWTLDDSWKKTALLRWFRPLDRSARERRGAQLWRSAYLSLAAIRRWQIQHDGQDPPDLKMAYKAIGLSQVPVDPYSGKQLRLFSNATSIGTYSVGPDGKDDRAEIVYDPFNSPIGAPPTGDFVFVLERQ